jgi:hypothetical protein
MQCTTLLREGTRCDALWARWRIHHKMQEGVLDGSACIAFVSPDPDDSYPTEHHILSPHITHQLVLVLLRVFA